MIVPGILNNLCFYLDIRKGKHYTIFGTFFYCGEKMVRAEVLLRWGVRTSVFLNGQFWTHTCCRGSDIAILLLLFGMTKDETFS